jgi:HAD superfamily hydrolase (TIGR01509 family)
MEYGLILDVDGVLADTESVNARASVDVFRRLYKVEVRPDEFRPFIGAGADRYMLGVAEKYGVRMNIDEATQRREDNFLRLLGEEGLQPYPGVLDLVGDATAAPDFRVAIGTSGTPTKTTPVIRAVGLDLRAFDAVVTSADLTRKKPDPEIYVITASRLALPPEQCVVVEDAPAGVRAARNAHAAAVAVTNSTTAEELAEADRIVDSLALVNLETLRALVRKRLEAREAGT